MGDSWASGEARSLRGPRPSREKRRQQPATFVVWGSGGAQGGAKVESSASMTARMLALLCAAPGVHRIDARPRLR